MTVPADRTYPANATNAAWQKKKSVLDKAMSDTKTGLGATLKEAELAWKAIPWADLDASTKTAATPAGAAKLRETAEEALKKVTDAKDKLKAAKEQAKQSKLNKKLSKGAMNAAAQIEIDLNTAINRLGTVKLTDFDTLVQKVQNEAVTKLRSISVSVGNTVVMTGTTATWDRKLFKVSGVVWKKGDAQAIMGKTAVVSAEKIASEKTEGGYLLFKNDMKLDSAGGNTATFKP